jgi:hypothetical protein
VLGDRHRHLAQPVDDPRTPLGRLGAAAGNGQDIAP